MAMKVRLNYTFHSIPSLNLIESMTIHMEAEMYLANTIHKLLKAS